MTYPRPLSDQAAARAVTLFEPGAGRCQLCGAEVWRYATSSDPARLVMFHEHAGGSFDFPASDAAYPVLLFVGKGNGCLAHHNCFICNPDEADQ